MLKNLKMPTIVYMNNIEKKTSNTSKNKKGKLSKAQKDKAFSLIPGAFAGCINGLFGGGGGMIVVPMLNYLLQRSEKKAHATAILIILPMSILSGILYACSGSFKLGVGIPATIGVTIGGIAGALLLKRLSSHWVSIIFSVIMAIAGLKLLFF